jgi:hypothetical protein
MKIIIATHMRQNINDAETHDSIGDQAMLISQPPGIGMASDMLRE